MPRSTCTLKLWGNILSHCVGGYGEYIKRGRSVIVGVMVEGVIKYTIEIVKNATWECNQFYGVRNSSPNPAFRQLIMEEIGEAVM
jgi:hypothetical protein